jgi:MFS family permease
MALFSVRFSAPLITKFGPVNVLGAGQVVVGLALGMLAFGPSNANYAVHLLVPLSLLGLGGGLSFPSLAIIAMSDAQPSDAGLASGILNTTGQVGGALGLAALATLAGWRTLNLVHDGAGSAAALAGGYHLAWLVGAGIVGITFALAMSLLRGRPSMPIDQQVECEAVA